MPAHYDGTAPCHSVPKLKAFLFLFCLPLVSLLLVAFGTGPSTTSTPTPRWIKGAGAAIQLTGFGVIGTHLVAGGPDPTTGYIDVFVSTDSGLTWHFTDSFQTNIFLPGTPTILVPHVSFDSNNGTLFAGIGGALTGAIYESTDGGNDWIERDSSFNKDVDCFTNLGSTVFAGTNFTTDGGRTWKSASGNLRYQVDAIACIGSELFVGTMGEGIYSSKNYGVSWIASSNGLTNLNISGMTAVGTDLLAGAFKFPGDSTGGVFLSTDGGRSWTSTDAGLTDLTVNILRSNGFDMFVGTNTAVFASQDTGKLWKDISTGTPVSGTGGLLPFFGRYLMVGSAGAWRYQFADTSIDTGVIAPQLPSGFTLSQNYPNPFNPTTLIKYQVPKNTHVTIKVYDVLGQKVATLVDGDISAGYHQVTFNGSDLASGVYFYRISTPGYSKVMKMLILK